MASSLTGFAITLALVLATAASSPIIAKLLRRHRRRRRRRRQSPRPDGIDVLVDPKDAKFEIVAVHGLGAHPEYTWTRKVATERVHLLRNLIAKDFPEARVLNFAYNSDWLVDAPAKTAQQIAYRLVEHLQRCRSGRRRLPILFIGHSFGGIVIKEALCTNGDDSKEIVDDTHGIIFLGTPHQGSAASTAGVMAASILTGFSGSDTTLLLSLRSHQGQLSDLDERFGQCMREKEGRRKKTRLVCFSETKPSWIAGIPIGIIVNRDSARCYDAEVVHVDVDHSGLNKCSGPNDHVYVMLRERLQRLRPTAPSIPSSSQLYVLTKLDTVKNAVFGSHDDEHEGECLPGTRQKVLRDINEWANDPARESIYWLQGMAGTGKSTIARTVARNTCLAASFFFKRGEGDRGKSRLFFTTLAAQLTQRLPVIADHLRNTLDIDPDIAYKALGYQFHELILKPLKNIHSDSSNVTVVVIDALDECEGDQDVESIIHQLSQLRHPEVYPLKLFITSRFEPPIRLGFERIDGEYVELPLHKIPAPEIEHDIAAFLRFRLEEQIRGRFRMGTGWPSRYQLQSLLEMAVPLFIFAATACRFIEDTKQGCGGPGGRLQHILDYRDRGELEAMYLPILNQTIHGLNYRRRHEALEEFKRIVGSIVTLANPLPATSLARLLGIGLAFVEDKLYLLHSVLDIPSNPKAPVKLFHESFRDFLTHSDQHDFWIDKSATNRMLAERCLQLLSEGENLRKDICDIKIAGTRREDVEREKVDEHLSPEVQYACLYWAHHLKESDAKLHDGHQAFRFLQTHLLHWLEAMSLMGRMTESIESIVALQRLVEADKGAQMSEFLYDAKRFILNGRPGIEQTPLQVYASALVFAPERSMVRQRFKSHIEWITTKPIMEQSWNSCLQTIVHQKSVDSVAFSHDGRLVSASDGIRMWDPENGALQRTVDMGHHQFSLVALSHDGRLLARSSEDPEIEVWDTVKGALQWRLPSLEGHTEVAFSTHNGGRLLASFASFPKSDSESLIQFWDLEKGTLLRTMRSGCRIGSLAFSVFNDGRLLASRSTDGDAKIWDAEKGALLRTLHEGQSTASHNHAVAFSPHNNGRLLALSLHGDTIEIWDAIVGNLQRKFSVHNEGRSSDRVVISLAFSGPGQLLASSSTYGLVKVWDAVTGQLLQTLEDQGSIYSVVFSHNGQLLASSSRDGAVKVWDATLRPANRQSTPKAHDSSVTSIALSADCRLVASGALDGVTNVWDAASGELSLTCPTYDDSCRAIDSITFSSDCRLLASVARRVRVWNSATGELQHTMNELPAFDSRVLQVVFSGDSQLLAGRGGHIFVWNTTTGAIQWTTAKRHNVFYPRSLTFSSDDKLLASVSKDGTIMVWSVSTGTLQWTLETVHHSFSDDRLLASQPHDDSVEVWDVSTGLLRRKDRQRWVVDAIAFLNDDRLLASVFPLDQVNREVQCVTLRDARTGALQQLPECYTGFRPSAMTLTEDGLHLFTRNGHALIPTHGGLRGQADGQVIRNVTVSTKQNYLGYSIDPDKSWIEWNGQSALWIPPDYRPSTWAMSKSTEMMAFSYYISGRVLTIGFSSAGPSS